MPLRDEPQLIQETVTSIKYDGLAHLTGLAP